MQVCGRQTLYTNISGFQGQNRKLRHQLHSAGGWYQGNGREFEREEILCCLNKHSLISRPIILINWWYYFPELVLNLLRAFNPYVDQCHINMMDNWTCPSSFNRTVGP